nr:glycosyltransferase [Lachnospiraceae bacterium]
EEQDAYYRVNCDLAVECAEKAKAEGVRQFIYLSSIIVYGSGARPGEDPTEGKICADTPACPSNFYGDSKLRAEEKLTALSDDSFRVCIVRLPMIYGPDCKGNYSLLEKMAKYLPVFPLEDNRRSVLSRENLCRALYVLITNESAGIYFPQDRDYMNTSLEVKRLAEERGRKIRLTRAFHPLIRLLSKGDGKLSGMAGKAFGSLYYDKEMSTLPGSYRERRKAPGTRFSGGEKPTITVVTVCYNAANALQNTMNSILLQTTAPDEYLIIDGASSDGTQELAEAAVKKFAARGIRMRVISEPDHGTYDAMNKGARLATGDVIAFLNAGDTYEPDCVRYARDTFLKTGCDCCFGNLRIYRTGGEKEKSPVIKRAKLRRFQTSRNWNHPTMFVRRDLMTERPFPCKGIHDDYGFYLSLVRDGKKIVTIPHVMADFYMGGISNHKSIKEAVARIRDRYLYCYRCNGFSPLYLAECIFIEGIKALF